MKVRLDGKRVAMLVTDGFEQSELEGPKQALEKAGAKVDIVSPAGRNVRAWDQEDWGGSFRVDVALKRANVEDFDALVIPGGVMSPDRLRWDKKAVAFVQAFVEGGKPVAAICHGPWMLIDAGVVPGRRMTSWPSLQTDLRNAGAEWVDEPVVVDHGMITSRKPGDIPDFNRKIIEEFAEGVHIPREMAREPQEHTERSEEVPSPESALPRES